MNLASLLLELKPLLADPDANFELITELLERHQGLAEYEVARFYVSRVWKAPVERKLRDVDARERLKGVRQRARRRGGAGGTSGISSPRCTTAG